MNTELVIIGNGPAGLTAAIYAARAAVKPIVLGDFMPGGQIANSAHVDNYPGFPEGISGFDLGNTFQEQAKRFEAQLVPELATKVDFSARPLVVQTANQTYQTKAVIIAAGANPRKLGIPGEKEFFGRGVSTCATCDGFFYKGKKVVVIGGGDSAIEEGIFLTKFASQVTVVHRRDELRASKLLQNQAFANPKIDFVWDSIPLQVLGEGSVTGVQIRNVKTDETSILETDGVFIYIGFIPATEIFQGELDLTPAGYVVTGPYQQTSVPGVFAAGDVENPSFRQVVVAAGAGATAAMQAERYLAQLE